jgi:hypothetical protein
MAPAALLLFRFIGLTKVELVVGVASEMVVCKM